MKSQRIKNVFKKSMSLTEKLIPLLSIIFFILGMWGSRASEKFAYFVDDLMANFIDGYVYIAPFVIFLIVTPAFAKILNEREANGKGFVRHSLLWFVKLRLLACVFACIFTALVFGLPLYANHSLGFIDSVITTFKSMMWMFTHSPYFYALYASILTVLVSTKVTKVRNVMVKGNDLIEKVGQVFVPLVPLFMLVIGSYVAHLPVNVGEQIGKEGLSITLSTINVFGFKINSNTPMGMVFAYLAGAFLTGLACFIWHFGLLFYAKYKQKDFSILKYFKDYWVKVYPILWATSSEALATPLNIYLIQKHYNHVRREVTNFVVGVGSFVNINGTMICVFVLAGLVAKMLGITISLVDLLMCVGVVFLIGFGVPGIPGELLMFGGPVVVLLGIAPEIAPVFLALYLGLQIGLPDSFRTGANSTDECVANIILGKVYNDKFLHEKEPEREGIRIPEVIIPSPVPIPVHEEHNQS
ncbi:MAG: cation:dicarboxylase symporter family transporter [Candidatus Ancaeobacter aquaticus]|nr:cation:dicarboxylase symporter family transporter [Candidatus Ancaeobacter aquaticus]